MSGTTAPVPSLPTLDTAVFSLVLAGKWGLQGYGVGYGGDFSLTALSRNCCNFPVVLNGELRSSTAAPSRSLQPDELLVLALSILLYGPSFLAVEGRA